MDHPDAFLAALHGDRAVPDGPDVAAPLHVSTTFDQAATDEMVYRRYHDVTRARLEAVLGALEGGRALTYPSGMAAIASVLRVIAPRRVALPSETYHATRALVEGEANAGRWDLVAADDLGQGDVRWIETPSNPRCLITDIAEASADASLRGAFVVVDSTFATPILQRPLALGATAVIHSTTKFINGHSDALGGVVVVEDPSLNERLAVARSLDGAVPGSLDAWLTLRGVRTLPLRVNRQSESAAAVAAGLVDHGLTVWYPGLASHPGHDIAVRQMSGFGGIVSFEVESADVATAVARGVRVLRRATSLGGVESLIEHRRGVDPLAPPGLLRVSVGLEPSVVILDDLVTALDRARP